MESTGKIVSGPGRDVGERDLLKVCKTVQHIVDGAVSSDCHDNGRCFFRTESVDQMSSTLSVFCKKRMISDAALL